jgi:hypothetical protein
MGKFSELGIKCEPTNLVGEKLNIKIILGEEIKIHKYKIVDSKYEGKCLYMQITWKGKTYVIFNGSTVLMKYIVTVPEEEFPLETIIVESNGCYIFT